MRVSLSTLSHWVHRAGDQRLDRVDWSDRSRRPQRLARSYPAELVQSVLGARKWLRDYDALGDHGGAAIREYLLERGQEAPSERTIARWIAAAETPKKQRRGVPPPPGWYLPRLASRQVELDRVDIVEGLRLCGRGRIEVLNCLSLWESLPGAHPATHITSDVTMRWLTEHWCKNGRPHYVQFDNDTVFSGAHARRNHLGRLVHWCLCLDVIPVFTPPLEKGFQAGIEAYNRRWQQRVWQRWRHPDLKTLRTRSEAFVEAFTERKRRNLDLRREWIAPARDPQTNQVVLLRRLSESGELTLCAQRLKLQRSWAHRLVRCEIDVSENMVRFFRLSRRDPHYQTHLAIRKIAVRLVPWWTAPR